MTFKRFVSDDREFDGKIEINAQYEFDTEIFIISNETLELRSSTSRQEPIDISQLKSIEALLEFSQNNTMNLISNSTMAIKNYPILHVYMHHLIYIILN